MRRSVLDIDDLLADPVLRSLAGDAKAAMAQSGKPTGLHTITVCPDCCRVECGCVPGADDLDPEVIRG